MSRAVLDINTIVSGLFWSGSPNSVLRLAVTRKFQLIISTELMTELSNVLSRDKFIDSRRKRGKTAYQLVANIDGIAEAVIPALIPGGIVRDPDDEAVLACAVGGAANYIVSGDKDLLVLGTYRSIPILTANQFLEVLAQDEKSV